MMMRPRMRCPSCYRSISYTRLDGVRVLRVHARGVNGRRPCKGLNGLAIKK